MDLMCISFCTIFTLRLLIFKDIFQSAIYPSCLDGGLHLMCDDIGENLGTAKTEKCNSFHVIFLVS